MRHAARCDSEALACRLEELRHLCEVQVSRGIAQYSVQSGGEVVDRLTIHGGISGFGAARKGVAGGMLNLELLLGGDLIGDAVHVRVHAMDWSCVTGSIARLLRVWSTMDLHSHFGSCAHRAAAACMPAELLLEGTGKQIYPDQPLSGGLRILANSLASDI